MNYGFNFDFSGITPKTDEEINAYYAAQEKQRKQKVYESLVPPRYWNQSLDNYDCSTPEQTKALSITQKYVEALKKNCNKCLVLLGKAGTGKTHLAVSTLREVEGIYKNIYEIIQEYHQARAFGSKETETQIIKKYGACSYLIIDEIGRGFNAEEEKFILYQIINTRYNYNRPTLLVSNKPSNEFLQFVGDAVRDRLIETGIIYDFGENANTYRINKRGKDEL